MMKTAAVIDEWALMRVGVETTLRRRALQVSISVPTATEFFARVVGPNGASKVDIVVVGQMADMTQAVAVRQAQSIRGLSVMVMTANMSPSSKTRPVDKCE